MEIKTEFYGLIKKSKTLEEVVIGLFKKKLTIKSYSILSNLSTRY